MFAVIEKKEENNDLYVMLAECPGKSIGNSHNTPKYDCYETD